jgi:endonuclease III
MKKKKIKPVYEDKNKISQIQQNNNFVKEPFEEFDFINYCEKNDILDKIIQTNETNATMEKVFNLNMYKINEMENEFFEKFDEINVKSKSKSKNKFSLETDNISQNSNFTKITQKIYETISSLEEEFSEITEIENKINFTQTQTQNKNFSKFSEIQENFSLIEKMRSTMNLPIDKIFSDLEKFKKISHSNFKFQVLLYLILSRRSKHIAIYNSLKNLHKFGLTSHDMSNLTESQLIDLIKSVGFFKKKAKLMHEMIKVIIEKYNSDPPETREDVLNLPGMGPKLTDVYFNHISDEIKAVSVSSHVHRVFNRLKWIETSDKEETKKKLEDLFPKDYWARINVIIDGFGENICKPLAPKCEECLLRDKCDFKVNNRDKENRKEKKKEKKKQKQDNNLKEIKEDNEDNLDEENSLINEINKEINKEESNTDKEQEQILDNEPDNKLDNEPDNKLENIRDNISENIRDNVLDNIRDNVLDNIRDNVLDNIRDNVQGNVPENVQGNVPEYVTEYILENVLENVLEKVPENIRDNVPENNVKETTLTNKEEILKENKKGKSKEKEVNNLNENKVKVLESTEDSTENDKNKEKPNVKLKRRNNVNKNNKEKSVNINSNTHTKKDFSSMISNDDLNSLSYTFDAEEEEILNFNLTNNKNRKIFNKK